MNDFRPACSLRLRHGIFVKSLIVAQLLIGTRLDAGQQNDLNFKIQSGPIYNHFLRRDQVAAHISIRSGAQPRFIAAFPAGNSGAGIWFDSTTSAHLELVGDPKPIDQGWRQGVSVTIRSNAKKLVGQHVILGSIRFMRLYEGDGWLPRVPKTVVTPTTQGARFQRPSFDGKNDYILEIEPIRGATVSADTKSGSFSIRRKPGAKEVLFEILALTSDTPLTPIPLQRILKKTPRTPKEQDLANALAFLSYEEKLAAGSWRFLTYFGRDTLLSIYLLRSVASAETMEAALSSVIERLLPDGNVAHEEEIGDWAAYRRSLDGKGGTPSSADPLYDYKMIDDDFMLVPVAEAYLLDPETDLDKARAFLSRKTATGLPYKDALLVNMRFVLERARPYAENPSYSNLIRLPIGNSVGDWRDSQQGLGGGVYPFSVNVALVPAALRAVANLAKNPLFSTDDTADLIKTAERLSAAWTGVAKLFEVTKSKKESRAALQAYTEHLGLRDPTPFLPTHNVTFHALSLTDDGEPVNVMHSDLGFHLLFNAPDPDFLEEAAAAILSPFPLGLLSPVGLIVANPGYIRDIKTWNTFTTSHYHGTVIWSWQQAMYLAGLRRQIARSDISDVLRKRLERAATRLLEVIANAPSGGREELWTYQIENGEFQFAPFGADDKHHSESNPVQLWSTVFLGIDGAH